MHTIRLREPWQATWAEAQVHASEGHSAARLACYRRKFNRPTGLDASQSVSLQLQCHTPVAKLTACLNRCELCFESPSAETFEVGVGPTLALHNQLEVRFPIVRLDEKALTEPPKLHSFMDIQLIIRG